MAIQNNYTSFMGGPEGTDLMWMNNAGEEVLTDAQFNQMYPIPPSSLSDWTQTGSGITYGDVVDTSWQNQVTGQTQNIAPEGWNDEYNRLYQQFISQGMSPTQAGAWANSQMQGLTDPQMGTSNITPTMQSMATAYNPETGQRESIWDQGQYDPGTSDERALMAATAIFGGAALLPASMGGMGLVGGAGAGGLSAMEAGVGTSVADLGGMSAAGGATAGGTAAGLAEGAGAYGGMDAGVLAGLDVSGGLGGLEGMAGAAVPAGAVTAPTAITAPAATAATTAAAPTAAATGGLGTAGTLAAGTAAATAPDILGGTNDMATTDFGSFDPGGDLSSGTDFGNMDLGSFDPGGNLGDFDFDWGSLPTGLTDIFKSALAPQGMNWLGLGSDLMGYAAQNNYQKDLIDTMNRAVDKSDPFASQRPMYQDMYKTANTDPNWLQNDSVLQNLQNAGRRNTESSMAAKGYLGSGNILHELQRTGTETAAKYALPRLEQLGQAAGVQSNPAAAGQAMSTFGPMAAQAGIGQMQSLQSMLGRLPRGTQNTANNAISGGLNTLFGLA